MYIYIYKTYKLTQQFLSHVRGDVRQCQSVQRQMILFLCRNTSHRENAQVHLTFVIYIVFQDLAGAGATKRPTCCVLVQTKPAKGEIEQGEQEKLKSDYDQVVAEVTELTTSLF